MLPCFYLVAKFLFYGQNRSFLCLRKPFHKACQLYKSISPDTETEGEGESPNAPAAKDVVTREQVSVFLWLLPPRQRHFTSSSIAALILDDIF